MAHSPFESWKRRAPSNRDEAQAAELIKKLGEAETLSPQAMHRVAHHLRAPARRLSLFSDVRLAAASVAILLLFVVGAWATIGYFDRQTDTTVIAAPRRPVQQTLALNDARPSAPTAPSEAPEGAAAPEPRLEEPELRRETKGERRAIFAKDVGADAELLGAPKRSPMAPDPGLAQSETLRRETLRNQGLKKSDSAAQPMAELAMRDEMPAVAMDARQRVAASRSAAPPSAQAAVPAPAAAESASAEGTGLTGMSVEGCRSTMPVDSATLERNSGDIEQALFRHGVCLLLLSKREAGTADLHAYLARFPNGRFAEGVRALLVKNPTLTPAH